MSNKSPPPRPAPRLYLATPLLDDPAALLAELPALLAAADVAAVLVRLKETDQRTMISRIKALAPVVQNAGAALLVDGHPEIVARGGAAGPALALGVEAELVGRRRVDAAEPDPRGTDHDGITIADLRGAGDIGRLRQRGDGEQRQRNQEFSQHAGPHCLGTP